MSLVLDEDESFSMQAFFTAPGTQRMVLRGMMTKQEGGVTYATPLLPQMFFGQSGVQLGSSWSQNISGTGEQTILSRSGGLPKLPPDEELFWRRVSAPQQVQPQPVVRQAAISPIPALAIVVVAGLALWWLTKSA